MNYCPNCGSKLEENIDSCLNCKEVIVNKTSRKIAKASVIFGYLSFYPLVFFGSIIGYILGVISVTRKDKYSSDGRKGMLLSIGSFVFWIVIVLVLIGYVLIYKGQE